MLPNFLSKRISYLNYFDLANNHFSGFVTDNLIALKTDAHAYFANRVCVSNSLVLDDIERIKKFYDGMPFTLWIEENQSSLISLLESNNFKLRISYPTMNMNIKNLKLITYPPNISVQTVINEMDFNVWLNIVAESYSLKYEDIKRFIRYIITNANPSKLKLYLGYYENVPVATSMAMMYEDTVAIHWIGTLPLYRNKGLGLAVTYQPIFEASNNYIDEAILFSSKMGKPLYEKIGFTKYSNYHVYGI